MSNDRLMTMLRAITALQDSGRRPPATATEQGMARVWVEDLGDFDAETIDYAVRTYRQRDGAFWPTTGQLRTIALDHMCGTPADAYEVAMQAMRTHGCSRLAKRGHATEAIQQTVARIGGWQAMNTDNDFAKREMRARFIAAFDAARNDNPVSAVLPDNQAKRLALAGE